MSFGKVRQFSKVGADKRLVFMTCYDYPTACWLRDTEIDGVLVGDSLSEVFYGYADTTKVDVDVMLRHTEAVKRGLLGSAPIHLIGDLPAGSYEDEATALKTARQFFDVGVDSVKLENPKSEVVEALRAEDLAVLGHVGLTPQTNQDYKLQGKSEDSARRILEDAVRLDELGCYGVVLEAIPRTLAEKITGAIKGISIGVAAGNVCDGEIRVYTDVVGLTKKKFVKPYGHLGEDLQKAINQFVRDHRTFDKQ